MARPQGLRVVTLVPGCGYGDAGSHYIAGLHALGVPVTWTPTIENSAELLGLAQSQRNLHHTIKDELLALWRKPLECSAILVDVPPPDWHLYWRRNEPDLRPYAYVAWEVEQVPKDWPPALNLYERVFVPSTFNQRALIAGGVTTPVDVVPHVARSIEPVVGGFRYGNVSDDDFLFYTLGTWTTRKAMEQTIRAFLEAFDARDRVALVVKTEPVDQIEWYGLEKRNRKSAPPQVAMVWWTVARILAEYPNPPKLHLIAEDLSAREIDRLHTRGDCFVSLAHSEGWGLCSFDATLFGNPVVMTGWGGHLEHLGEDYPLLVRYDLRATQHSKPDGYYLRSEKARWAHADRTHAARLMRWVFEDPDWAKAIARDRKNQVEADFSSEAVCRRMASLMKFEVG